MEKKKLKLNQLKVQSFITEIDKVRINTLKAGNPHNGSEEEGQCGGKDNNNNGDKPVVIAGEKKKTGGVGWCSFGCTVICP